MKRAAVQPGPEAKAAATTKRACAEYEVRLGDGKGLKVVDLIRLTDAKSDEDADGGADVTARWGLRCEASKEL
jgi:hypothetical protein